MALRHLRDMGLDVEQVGAAAGFLQAYANTCLAELAAVPGGPPRGEALREEPAFTIAADAATALREAGQWLMYSDPAGARAPLRQAGELFLDLGQPFGAYLMEVAAEGAGEAPYRSMLRAVAGGRPGGEAGGEQRPGGGAGVEQRPAGEAGVEQWPALAHPQQQAYLMLAVTGGESADRFAGLAAEILETSPHTRGVVPVGALGTPIRHLWDVAAHLLARQPASARVVGGHLAGMARRYAETMSLAQVNEHLWRHAATAVDVGDIDVAGVAALAARRFGPEAMLRGVEEAGVSPEHDRIAMAPIEAGATLAQS